MLEKEIKEFLYQCTFGGFEDPYSLATSRAYRDLCRTLRLKGKDGSAFRAQASDLISAEVEAIKAAGVSNQDQYDSWHFGVCEKLVRLYAPLECGFCIGHAQKWVNMTMKYLCVFEDAKVLALLPYLHVPVDSYVFSAATKLLGVAPCCCAWSKIDSYDLYLSYQQQLRDALDIAPLQWEFSAWNEVASR